MKLLFSNEAVQTSSGLAISSRLLQVPFPKQTICPNFDLCEACYEVLDGDRLPPPHFRDHPMLAIPIEVETLGGDGNEIHFSTNDLSDSSLLPNHIDRNADITISCVPVGDRLVESYVYP
ncbi:Auxin transport protein BIG [Camellia lanceoleosa]|uniref:Auxin transport protein BIG n=1 Tax=Camellia lanceoleosa TaxID=1840588 RepID=A0ACC0GMP0_9ERIC|nr:Auxin transport protein BIG [Camellia lanceoleosa]